MLLPSILLWFWQASVVYAERLIEANALVSCMEDNMLTTDRLKVNFWPNNGTLEYDVSVNIGIGGYVYANISVYAFGFTVIEKTFDPCGKGGLKQLCPLYSGKIDLKSSASLGHDVIGQIPGIAFTFPNIDLYAIVEVFDRDTRAQVGCVRIELDNTKTVATTAVKWVTACISGASFIGSILFLYFGSIGTSQHIFAVSSLMFQYFQSMALLNLESIVRVPPIANAWSENLSWSLGLIYNETIQKAFRWYIQATGGHPSTYKIYPVISVLPQRVKRSIQSGLEQMASTFAPRVRDWATWHTQTDSYLDSVAAVAKRENKLASELHAHTSEVLLVLRGIKRAGYNMGIEYTSIVITAFVMFWFFLFACAVIFGVLWLGFWILHRQSRDYFKHRHAAAFTPYIGSVFKGVMLYICYMGFAPVLTFSLWEFTVRDSAAVVVAACFMLVAIVAIMAMSIWRVLRLARRSIKETGTPAYLLYSDLHFRHRYSFLYGPYHAGYFWFLYVYFAALAVKCIFLGLSQSSGPTQAMVIWLIELVVLVLMCWKKPYFNKATNVINIAMQVIIMLNALFYLFFSNLFTQPIAVNGVMGILYFILNAAFSLILLLYVIIYSIICIVRRDPDAHVTPVKDDRMSFMDEKIAVPGDNAELTALGIAAQADHDDTEVASETHNWFKTEDGADPASHRNPFGHDAPRRYQSNERLNTMTSEGTSFRNSTLMDVPDIDTVDAHVGSPGGHRMTNSQTTMDIMSGFPGGNMPTGSASTMSPTFNTSDSLNPNGTSAQRKKKWWGN